MTQLPALLSQFEDEWRQAGYPVDNFREGLPADTVRRKLESIGLAAPTEVVEWFGWHNGCATPALITPYYIFLDLDECIRFHQDYFDDPLMRPRDWLPFLVYGGGGYGLLNCSQETDFAITGCASREIELYPSRYQFPSLSTVVDWWIDLVSSRLWFFDERSGEPRSRATRQDLAKYPPEAEATLYV